MNLNDLFTEEKVRLDPHCWHNKKIGNPKTKVKGGTRVNNCVPKESVEEGNVNDFTHPNWANGQQGVDQLLKNYNANKAGASSPSPAPKPVTPLPIKLSKSNDEEDDVLGEKSVSQAQFRTMAAAAHNPKFARKVGISTDVAKEFHSADKHSNYKKLPDRTTEGKQQKGADYRPPKEAEYGPEYDDMVARVKRLAGLGPLKTVYDPKKRQYRNMPTAQQPQKK